MHNNIIVEKLVISKITLLIQITLGKKSLIVAAKSYRVVQLANIRQMAKDVKNRLFFRTKKRSKV